jgi:ribosomal protein S6--L-glutamate ligase
MVLSFHPLIKGDMNRLCAGREPDPADVSTIRRASAVILPQGCPLGLYRAARDNCPHVFPNYDARFEFTGKTGQIQLFRRTGARHPRTELFENTAAFNRRHGRRSERLYPVVFKFDWGGEGETVFLVPDAAAMEDLLQRAAAYERSGQRGFMLQEYVPCGGRSLRVVVIGQRMISYWRVQEGEAFYTGVSQGGRVDAVSEPDRKQRAEAAVFDFCERTGINLAGIDLLFDCDRPQSPPLLLEINYFFGRTGLGGSEAYYRVLRREVRSWLRSLPG